MSFAAIINAAREGEGLLSLEVPEGWRQGRTAYGGFSAALAFEAARSLVDASLPLRSALVSFIGPVSGAVQARAHVQRKGRSSVFVAADLHCEGALCLCASFVFMAQRESQVVKEGPPPPSVQRPVPETAWVRKAGPEFAEQFDFAHAAQKGQEPPAGFLRWARVKERAGLDPASELILIADALPPAAMALMATPAPASSVTWMVNVLSAAAAAADGWWLLSSQTDEARFGLSSQSMTLWSSDGRPAVIGMQQAALFG